MVVAAAILDASGERVLAARRTRPPESAGRWELPGGKVEPGESPADALVREIGEELGCLVDVLDWLPGEGPIGDAHVLRAATARITAGEPRPREHDRIRWLAAHELEDVDWLEPDRPFLAPIRHVLDPDATDPDERVRAIFFEESGARAVSELLLRDGWQASVERERYQGEDDDEDHPWAVVTDAPAFLAEILVDEYDGWLDASAEEAAEEPPGAVPPDLPTAPRRIKRPGLGGPL